MPKRPRSAAEARARHEDPPAKIVAAVERLGHVGRLLLWEAAKDVEHALSPIQIQTMLFLRSHEESLARVGELAQELMTTPATVSEMISALDRKGLVEKVRSEDDGRVRVLRLTEAGVDVADGLTDWARPLEEAFSRFDDAEQAVALRVLLAAIARLQDAGVVQKSRMCFTCRYFEPAGSVRRSPRCRLLDRPLPDRSLRIDCPEHEPARS